MAEVMADMTFGFVATPYYFSRDLTYHDDVKAIIDNELDSRIPAGVRDAVFRLAFLVPNVPPGESSRPSAPESDVENEIQVRLQMVRSDPAVVDEFTVGTVQDIVYVWEGGDRYCEHTYGIARNGFPWITFDHEGVEAYEIIVRLRWS